MSNSNKQSVCPCIQCSPEKIKHENDLKKFAKQNGVSVDEIKFGYAGGVNFRRVIKTPKSARASKSTRASKRINKKGGTNPVRWAQKKLGYNVSSPPPGSNETCLPTCCAIKSTSRNVKSTSSPEKPKSHSEPRPKNEDIQKMYEKLEKDNKFKYKHLYDTNIYKNGQENLQTAFKDLPVAKGEEVEKYVKLNIPSYSMEPKGKQTKMHYIDDKDGKKYENEYVFHKGMALSPGKEFVGFNSVNGEYMPVIYNKNRNTLKHTHHGTYESFQEAMNKAKKEDIIIGKDTYNDINKRYKDIQQRNNEWRDYGREANEYYNRKYNDALKDKLDTKLKEIQTHHKDPNIQWMTNPNMNQGHGFVPGHGHGHGHGQGYGPVPGHDHGQGYGGRFLTTRRVIKPTTKTTKSTKGAKGAKPKKPKVIKIRKPPKTLRTKKAAPRKLKV